MGGKALGSRDEKVLLFAREQDGQDQELGHQRDGSCSGDKARADRTERVSTGEGQQICWRAEVGTGRHETWTKSSEEISGCSGVLDDVSRCKRRRGCRFKWREVIGCGQP